MRVSVDISEEAAISLKENLPHGSRKFIYKYLLETFAAKIQGQSGFNWKTILESFTEDAGNTIKETSEILGKSLIATDKEEHDGPE